MRRRTRRTLLLAAAALGCDRGADDAGAGTAVAFTLDTLASGAVVARNAIGAGAAPVVALREVVRIGAADGTGADVFGRVSDVAIAPDDRVYVLDGIAQEVRVFDFDGRHVRTIGREGGGPGEFRGAYALAHDAQGRLWVADESQARYSVFDTAGTFVETRARPIRWPVQPGAMGFATDGALHEHGWWGRAGGVVRMAAGDTVTVRDTVPLPAYARPPLHQRPAQPGREQLGMPMAFAPRSFAAVGPDGTAWAGIGDAYRIARLGARGDTLRIVELDVAPAPFTEPERAMVADTAEAVRRRGLTETVGAVPTAHPYFTGLVVSDAGELWVRRPSAAAPVRTDGGRGAVYDVFDADGRLLGSTPLALDEHPAPQIVRGYVVGVTRDSLDVPYVAVYRRVLPP